MNEKMKRLLTPEGVRDLLPGMAEQKREVENKVQDYFRCWGYREVSTPAFEYSVNFAEGMKAGLEEKIYRFPDERGRTLVLRPDFTFPLARVAATHMAGEPKPLRLCYGGNVYRYTSSQQGRQRELTQAGVELIGAGCPGADAETVALAAGVLKLLGLRDFTLCLGHTGFLQMLLAAHGVEPDHSEKIKQLFHTKDFVSLKQYVAGLSLTDHSKECILRLPSLRGGKEVMSEAMDLVPAGRAGTSLAVLTEIWDILEDYGSTPYVTVDLGLVRTMDYYTGMVFEGYTSGLGLPICGGGRYDHLLGLFGPELPAVGFALNIDHLLVVLQRLRQLPRVEPPVFVAYASGARGRAVAESQRLRLQGVTVLIDTMPRNFDEARGEGEKRAGARLLYFTGESCDGIAFSLPESGSG